jgi:hypothetical protein
MFQNLVRSDFIREIGDLIRVRCDLTLKVGFKTLLEAILYVLYQMGIGLRKYLQKSPTYFSLLWHLTLFKLRFIDKLKRVVLSQTNFIRVRFGSKLCYTEFFDWIGL